MSSLLVPLPAASGGCSPAAPAPLPCRLLLPPALSVLLATCPWLVLLLLVRLCALDPTTCTHEEDARVEDGVSCYLF